MARQNHTRESIIQTLQNIASQLGTTVLSKRDVATRVSLSAVNYRFGNLGNALKAAGLAANAPGPPDGKPHNLLNDDDLFMSLLEVEKQIGHAPSLSEYRANGGTLSSKPFRTRFGKWDAALQHYRKWKAERGVTAATSNETQIACDARDSHDACQQASSTAGQLQNETWRSRKPPQLFGQPIDFRGLRHAPINEQGVVYLFGMVSRELGFSVEALQ